MDFVFSKTVKRHLCKIQHECNKLLDKGVFKDEIDSYSIGVPMFGRGESTSEAEFENIQRFYKYLSAKKIAVGNLPLHPSDADGTLDYAGEGDGVFEYITVQYVTVFDYDALKEFVDKRVFGVSSIKEATYNHLRGRALSFNGEYIFYHENKVKALKDTKARNYLLAALALIKEEEGSVDCREVALLCGEPEEGAAKRIKDALNQTVIRKIAKFNERSRERNFALDTSIEDVIVIKNPRLYKVA